MRRLLKILLVFPTKFLRKVDLIPLIVCQDLKYSKESAKAEMKKAMKKNLIVIKLQEDKELKKMMFRIIFMALLRKSENFIANWRVAEGNLSPTLAGNPQD
mmetsp:Transcript_5716/g.4884  ORF Transcript_5716/g.4884 Transcript_5716/m.4884 type:complete len:101 (-) Transcript_5716:316-618(-)